MSLNKLIAPLINTRFSGEDGLVLAHSRRLESWEPGHASEPIGLGYARKELVRTTFCLAMSKGKNVYSCSEGREGEKLGVTERYHVMRG